MTDITTSEHLGTEIHPKEMPNAIASLFHKNGEFHSDPVCTDPVQNFPILEGAGYGFYSTNGFREGFLEGGFQKLPKTFTHIPYKRTLFLHSMNTVAAEIITK